MLLVGSDTNGEYSTATPRYPMANLFHNIVTSWITNGIIDSKHRQYLLIIMKKLIATCKKMPTMEDYQLYYSAFIAILDYTINNDNQHTSNDVVMSYGFPFDIDAHGKHVLT
jgi:hypothetical protein